MTSHWHMNCHVPNKKTDMMMQRVETVLYSLFRSSYEQSRKSQ